MTKKSKRKMRRNISTKQKKQMLVKKPVAEVVQQVVEKPKKEKRKGVMYFTTETEDAIVRYNLSQTQKERSEIYTTGIQFALEKLVENIYNTYKFSYAEVPAQIVMKEALSHLVQNLSKYSKEKGKAFGYFSTVAKNWFIINNNNTYARFKRHVEICEQPSDLGEFVVEPETAAKKSNAKDFVKLMVDYWEKKISSVFSSEEEINIATQVVELFKNCDRLELINKKALYLYIREMTGCDTNSITRVINKMKFDQTAIYKEFLSNGTILT